PAGAAAAADTLGENTAGLQLTGGSDRPRRIVGDRDVAAVARGISGCAEKLVERTTADADGAGQARGAVATNPATAADRLRPDAPGIAGLHVGAQTAIDEIAVATVAAADGDRAVVGDPDGAAGSGRTAAAADGNADVLEEADLIERLERQLGSERRRIGKQPLRPEDAVAA